MREEYFPKRRLVLPKGAEAFSDGPAIKDSELSLLWVGLDSWPGKSHMPPVQPKKKGRGCRNGYAGQAKGRCLQFQEWSRGGQVKSGTNPAQPLFPWSTRPRSFLCVLSEAAFTSQRQVIATVCLACKISESNYLTLYRKDLLTLDREEGSF